MLQILHWPWRAVPQPAPSPTVCCTFACVAHTGPAVLVLQEGVLEMECGGKGSSPLPISKQQVPGEPGARPFLGDPPLWVLMVELVNSDSWDTGLMGLNLWLLTHLWTQVVLTFVLITNQSLLAWFVNIAIHSKEIPTFRSLGLCGRLFKQNLLRIML